MPHDSQDRPTLGLGYGLAGVGMLDFVLGSCRIVGVIKMYNETPPGIQDRSKPEPKSRGMFRLAFVLVPGEATRRSRPVETREYRPWYVQVGFRASVVGAAARHSRQVDPRTLLQLSRRRHVGFRSRVVPQ